MLASSQTKRHLAVFVAAAAAEEREDAIPEFRCPSVGYAPLFVLPVPGAVQLQGDLCCLMT